jgi:hypothetical protein
LRRPTLFEHVVGRDRTGRPSGLAGEVVELVRDLGRGRLGSRLLRSTTTDVHAEKPRLGIPAAESHAFQIIPATHGIVIEGDPHATVESDTVVLPPPSNARDLVGGPVRGGDRPFRDVAAAVVVVRIHGGFATARSHPRRVHHGCDDGPDDQVFWRIVRLGSLDELVPFARVSKVARPHRSLLVGLVTAREDDGRE